METVITHGGKPIRFIRGITGRRSRILSVERIHAEPRYRGAVQKAFGKPIENKDCVSSQIPKVSIGSQIK